VIVLDAFSKLIEYLVAHLDVFEAQKRQNTITLRLILQELSHKRART